jgi:hypothetical protein
VFRDVGSIPAGRDFRETTGEAVGQCSVALVVIGPQWAACEQRRGPNDHVRFEIESALSRDIPVIPVLVGGATMPPTESLPPALGAFDRQ